VLLHGPPASRNHRRATLNFCRSVAAWAVACYLLQIKDRHNGNIMLHAMGHVVHIDFGFLLSCSPGGNMNFEAAPFKLTSEYVDLMGGTRSATFARFRDLVIKGFLAARKHADKLLVLAELSLEGSGRSMPCFRAGRATIDDLRARFQPDLSRRQARATHRTAPHRTAPHRTAPHRTAPHRTAPHCTDATPPQRPRNAPATPRPQCARFVDDMINRSIDHWTTTCYDKYQRCWLGIM
jgi:hypothetical protein